jgi:hypothetical protein
MGLLFSTIRLGFITSNDVVYTVAVFAMFFFIPTGFAFGHFFFNGNRSFARSIRGANKIVFFATTSHKNSDKDYNNIFHLIGFKTNIR